MSDVADDQAQAGAVAAGLARIGASLGASLVAFNAAAQRQAAEVSDAVKGPAIGRVVKAQIHSAANDHHATPKQPGDIIA